MFGCIYQLWDWLDAPPLFNGATMDAKKLQQLQQANAQKKLPLAYQTNLVDYRAATHSPVFQQHQAAGMSAYHVGGGGGGGGVSGSGYQQSPTATSSSGGPLTPIDMQPQPNKMLLKHLAGSGGNTSSSSHSSPYHQSSYNSGGEQLYQSPTERTYLTAAGRLQATSSLNPATALQQQYQQLQQAKLQAQMQTQNEAVQQQQRTFAMRQALNPPVPQGHFHMSQSSSVMSSMTTQQQQQQQQSAASAHGRAPPSTLNLNSPFQPAGGPLKVNQKQQPQHYHSQDQQQIYAQQQQQHQHQQQHQIQMQLQHQQQLQQQHVLQQQQRLKSEQQTPGNEQSPVYIQQNHPGHVVNQACQTQISAVKGGAVVQKTTPSSEDSSGKSPSHAPLDRKKSIGSMQALKSPITKRPPSSPVTLSGWLYKQGSDGLKVWRKRWFVLAEYCLYYYKGPEEEKLLGSILLPSYKVSACLPEDKIYRKYAFKCEHQNMRTYWLAAETGEAMVQWVRALTAATTMQAPNSGESDQPSGSSSLNHSGENSDSGIHTLQSQQSKMSLNQGQVTPASEHANANSASSSNSGGGANGGGGGAQPLYANAPPKPRRINDGGYSSPSPEHSIDNERKSHHQQQQTGRHGGVMSPTLQQMQQQQQHYQQQTRVPQQPQQHHAIYDTRTGNVSSALRLQQAQQQYSVDQLEAQLQQQMSLSPEDYPKSPPPPATHSNYMDIEEQMLRMQQQQRTSEEIYGERELYMQKLMQQRYPPHLTLYPNAERRTPDAYGRSKNRIFSDYEDIYNLTQAGMPTSAQEALLQEAASYRRPLSPPSYDGSKHVPAMPMRYTPNHMESASAQQQLTASNSNLRTRPTAAIARPHSADFLEYEARAESAAAAAAAALGSGNQTGAIKPDALRAPRPKSSLDINRTPDSFYYSEASYAEKMRKSALYLQHPQSGGNAASAQPQQAGGYRTANDFLSGAGSGMHTIGYENPYERAFKRGEQLHDGQGAASMPRMSRSNTTTTMNTSGLAHLRSQSMHPQSQALLSPQSQQKQQPPPPQKPVYTPTMSTQQIIQQSEQFLRSASARLPKRSGGFDDDYNSAAATLSPQQQQQMQALQQQTQSQHTQQQQQHQPTAQDGERKREESMKRLLEWKQRMLQSPLTRKGMQQGGNNMSAMSKLGSNPNILLASTTVASGAHYAASNASGGGNSSGNAGGGVAAAGAVGGSGGGVSATVGGGSLVGGSLVGGVGGIQRSRSEVHANLGPAGYNSYSSDDEECPKPLSDGDNTNGRPAGRSTTTTTTITTTSTITTSTTTTTTTTLSTTTNASTAASAVSHQTATTKTNVSAFVGQTIEASNKCNIATKSTIAFAETNTHTTVPTPIHTNSLLRPTKTAKALAGQLTPQRSDTTDAQKATATATATETAACESNKPNNIAAPNATTTSSTASTKAHTGSVALKPILKCHDSSTKTTDTAYEQQAITMSPVQRAKLQLNMAALKAKAPTTMRDATMADMPDEVPILPKKPAPKSPQITTYTPVYTTKTLTASPPKTYENVEFIASRVVGDVTADTEVASHTSAIDVEETVDVKDNYTGNDATQMTGGDAKLPLLVNPVTEAAPPKSINEQETPMLAQLRVYQRIQEANLNAEKPKTEEVSEEGGAEEIVRSQVTQASAADVIAHEAKDGAEDDDDTPGEEYTDDDLDEALAEEVDEAEAGNELAANEKQMTQSRDELTAKTEAPAQETHESKKPAAPEFKPTVTDEPRTPFMPTLMFDESHYLPMTPKKSDLAQSGNFTLISTHDSTAADESPYVEMCKNLIDEDSKSNYEIMCINPHAGPALTSAAKLKQSVEQSEPVYMELCGANSGIVEDISSSAAPQFNPNPAPIQPPAPPLTADELHSSSGKSTLKKSKKSADTLKKKAKKSTTERSQCKRKDLPDILKQSQGTMTHVSDSSDADDESTKHSDLKKMRSRTRFSLSDTFRPASYYLGASTPLADCAESSDSEIVSPPPIPASPPPMENLKTEEIFSSEHYDTVKRRDSSSGSATKINISYEQIPKLHASNTSLNRQKAETTLKSSRLSLPDQFSKHRSSGHFKTPHASALLKHHERTLSDSNYSFQTDNSSNNSSDFDFYNKLKQNSPSYVATPGRYQSNSSLPQKFVLNATTPAGDSSETDSAVEFRHRQGSDSELERQRSRRPLSEESISEIESLREKFEETLSHDLDTYLSHLQSNDLYLYQNTLLDAPLRIGSTDLLTKLIKPPEIFRNKDDEHFYGNIRFVSSTDSLQRLGGDNRENSGTVAGASCQTPTSSGHDHDNSKYYTPLHSRNNSNISDKSAPYYYSELNSSRELLATPTAPLNNQRDVHAHGSNIAHIHNPIEGHAISNINVDLLADKDRAIDSKNLYKMKTNIEKLSYRSGKILNAADIMQPSTSAAAAFVSSASAGVYDHQRRHAHATKLSNFQQTNLLHTHTELTPSISMSPAINRTPIASSQTHSPYPTYSAAIGVHVAGGGAMKVTNMQQQQLSRSNIVGVVAHPRHVIAGEGSDIDMVASLDSQPPTNTNLIAAQAAERTQTNNATKFSVPGATVTGELLWEEDTLWRESLRRVSQRHARSLDDLDRIAASPTALMRRELHAADRTTSKTKITRDVTYVNDNVSHQMRAAYKPRLSEPLSRPVARGLGDMPTHADEDDRLNENDVYVQLLADHTPSDDHNSDVYEVLRADSGSNLSHKSAEIDRETIRQWDSMSSGLMKHSGSNSNSENDNPCGSESLTSVGSTVRAIMEQLNVSCDDSDNVAHTPSATDVE
ncbi:PREDICTED: serine-rich adhesin for platelets-like [Rhagoletis zephyria]|uniref:serine-rich adhesin for platelets-like n=1 Tax=Rhagoletis zephyria TaxID=28612 RepID=UPI00081135F1|nr:PREDICTED: serine-rich adhesin for platelets-like [Rhagoletis zephyria]XP_017491235.1 PREDICTED: serine-rich adhesin for platelets-like [Rhagoletis zephyria]